MVVLDECDPASTWSLQGLDYVTIRTPFRQSDPEISDFTLWTIG
jgi:hypothetical protein